ncbi:nardilysin-like protein [Plasmopara halstedii]|uniref:Nardilysin-like protein n=1 Tax=Plasmopara halstedii TaxID=4781 RepID=A0A0P1B5X9_PLAHL|nr:nardilysin-like protein [Plasmopara halstedii]CEG50209.1 nardilysin-like protein [Plasmopara halstedii]|eukprot:XP_024586578.1 nardilysin-like protein [Plasmopara halstedii]
MDKKSYRLLTLRNGLEVLLIQSDDGSVSQSTLRPKTDLIDHFSTSMSEDIEPVSMEEENIGMDKKASAQAAVCLTVSVGSLSDPKELPGLAHFLEHMVFLGSETYPEEAAFEAYLDAHGGSCNGATECESTRFEFDVDSAYLLPALHMFASLIVAPLLQHEAMERELKAIESEFQRVRNSNVVRLQQVMCSTSIQEHPFSHCFTWGNLESLKHSPERNGVNVREHMLHLHKSHYVAPYMKVCVYGTDSLDVLQQFVTQIFSSIPCRRDDYDKPSTEKLGVTYGGWADQKPMLLRVVPVDEKCTLQLYWMLSPMMQNYRQKPWLYVGCLLEHGGPSSISSILKRKQWATDVIAGTSDQDGYEFGSFGTVFEIRVSLTDRGLACWEQIAQVIFDTLHLFSDMAANGKLPSWLFEELRLSREIEFQFQEDDKEPIVLCRELSKRMISHLNIQQCCNGDLLRYELIQGEFDTGSVCDLLTSLTANSVRVVLMAPSFAKTLDVEALQTERWFGIKHTIESIRDASIEAWTRSSIQSIELLPLPAPNPFMPRSFYILPVDPSIHASIDIPPKLIVSTSSTQLWYKGNQTFMVPKACVSVLITPPVSTATSQMFIELHLKLVKHRLQQILEHAYNATFEVDLSVRDEAIEAVFAGFSDTLPDLVRAVMQEVLCPFKAFENASELTLVQGELERGYRKDVLSPKAKASEIRLHMLEKRVVTTEDKLKALQDRNGHVMDLAADLTRFLTESLLGCIDGKAAMRCLIIGNMSRDAAIELVEDIQTLLTRRSTAVIQSEPEPELGTEFPIVSRRYHTIALPLTANGLLIRRESRSAGERNSVVEVYFQIGKVCIVDRAYALLLRTLLAQPLYSEMRTKQQLGYLATCIFRDTHDVLGLSLIVQSASHAAGALALRLDKFLHKDFPRNYLESEKHLSPKSFASYVQSLQRLYARFDLTLAEQSERYWEEIATGRLKFDLDAQVANALANCTREGLLARYQCWLQGSSSCYDTCPVFLHEKCKTQHHTNRSHGSRKLRVHIVGQSSPIKPFEQLVSPAMTPLIIANDMFEFKRSLKCHCHKDP